MVTIAQQQNHHVKFGKQREVFRAGGIELQVAVEQEREQSQQVRCEANIFGALLNNNTFNNLFGHFDKCKELN